MTTNPPIACALGAEDAAARHAEMAEIGAAALLTSRLVGTHMELRFRAEPTVSDRLAAIIDAEAVCCPFLTLSLVGEEDAITLLAHAPTGAEPVLAAIADAFGAQT